MTRRRRQRAAQISPTNTTAATPIIAGTNISVAIEPHAGKTKPSLAICNLKLRYLV
jgi:hypothetical protein